MHRKRFLNGSFILLDMWKGWRLHKMHKLHKGCVMVWNGLRGFSFIWEQLYFLQEIYDTFKLIQAKVLFRPFRSPTKDTRSSLCSIFLKKGGMLFRFLIDLFISQTKRSIMKCIFHISNTCIGKLMHRYIVTFIPPFLVSHHQLSDFD